MLMVSRALYVAVFAIGHELIELGAVLGVTQLVEKVAELALFIFEPLQGFSAVVVEGVVAA